VRKKLGGSGPFIHQSPPVAHAGSA
jgi:hypothetical protein